MNRKFIKVIGLVATVVGLGATLITDWVNDKKMDERIEEKINDALSNHNNENGEES